jgi:hypothetical protein
MGHERSIFSPSEAVTTRVVSMKNATQSFLDEAPSSLLLTGYDHIHMTLYLRLLDAERDGADWREVVRILFDLDPDREPERCRHMHETHLARAKWMSRSGYRQLQHLGR